MKLTLFAALLSLLTGCQQQAPTSTARGETAFWYDVGYQDALSGIVVRDDDVLAEWFGTPQVDRAGYLRGYAAGQSALCHDDQLFEWGKSDRNFPASCDGVANAERLRAQWQRGADLPRQ